MGMPTRAVRVSRVEQTGQNRERVLGAARRVFMAKGFHVATLDEIALEAGFSKGVIYSQFASKADMFLALLERRIEERAASQARFVERLDGLEDFEELIAEVMRVSTAEPAWRLLVIEFRVFAARDRKLNRRYAELHDRAIAGIAAILRPLFERSGVTPVAPFEVTARYMLALENGMGLEDAVSEPIDAREASALMRRLIGIAPAAKRGRTR